MTTRIGIDFKRKPSITLLEVILLLAGVGSALLIWDMHEKVAKQAATWENAIHRVDKHAFVPARLVSTELHSKLDPKYAQEVLKHLNLPWEDLFSVLEKAVNEDIALVSLKPDPVRGQVRISGEARNLYAMLAYAERLQDQKYFTDVTMAEHEIVAKGGDKPVHFQLLAKWKP